MNQIVDLLRSHRSIRSFRSDPVSHETIQTIIEAAAKSATSNYIQAYSVIRVTDMETRRQIAELAGPQTWVEKSPVFLMFCADLKRSMDACLYENKEMISGLMEQLIVATVDVAIVAQSTLLAAESLGLGGVFIGGIRNNPEKVCELLKIPDLVYPVFGMCLGYPAEIPEQKPRLPVNEILMEDCYQEHPADFKSYNEICSSYYQSRSSGSREDTWTRQMSAMLSKPKRAHMKAFIEKKGFGTK